MRQYRIMYAIEGSTAKHYFTLNAESEADAGVLADQRLGENIESNFTILLIQDATNRTVDQLDEEAETLPLYYPVDPALYHNPRKEGQRTFVTILFVIALCVALLCMFKPGSPV